MTNPSERPTERVGRYQLLEPMGVGPCGEVSRAKVFGVAGFERQFAVKRFHAELTATSATAAMLSAAARAYGSLEHPRIARMAEFAVAQGTTFTAVELVPGLDAMRLVAEARLAGNTLAAGGALALISQAARAVGYAHGRGLTHLGLSPTNVIVTADGDIKITDFGILSATLPPRPTDVARLANRIPYLAPEQLAHEATSAATDVFALGVIAYELVTGQRTFRGDSPAQVAQAIMAGPPAEPPLPRPIVRVLQRCLARSPFERFPDARALADALDAALRVAPVPGTRKDIGAQVKETLDRLAMLNEGEMSGMVAMNIGTGPVLRVDPPASEMEELERASQATLDLVSTTEFVRPDVPVAGPSPLVGPDSSSASLPTPSTTFPDMARPMTTVPGLAPPPIPVPQGIGAVVSAPIPSLVPAPNLSSTGSVPAIPPVPAPGGAQTLLGIAKPPAAIPPIKSRPVTAGGVPPAIPSVFPRPGTNGPSTSPLPSLAPPRTTGSFAVPPPVPRAAGSVRPETDLAVPSEVAMLDLEPDEPLTAPLLPAIEISAPVRESLPTEEMSPVVAEHLAIAATKTTTEEMESAVAHAWRQGAYAEFPDEAHVSHAGRDVRDVPAGASASGLPPPGPAAPLAPSSPTSPSIAVEAPAPWDRPRPPTAPPPPLDIQPWDSPVPAKTMLGVGGRAQGQPTPAPAPAPWAVAPSFAGNAAAPQAPLVAQPTVSTRKPSGGKWIWAVIGVLGAGAAGAVGWYAYTQSQKSDAPAVAEKAVDAKGSDALATNPNGSGAAGMSNAAAGSGAVGATNLAGGSDAAGMSNAAAGSASATNPTGSGAAGATNPATTPDAAQVAATNPPDAPTVAAKPIDAAQVAATNPPDAPAAAAKPIDAAQVAAAKPIDAAPAKPPVADPGAKADQLVITSTPPGARVFLDGADTGATPLKLPGTPDRHTVALLLPGHDLYVAQVDGHGAFAIPLTEVTPQNGPAGIKVLKCAKDRYYVFVDGKPTGQLCPTERIGTTIGPHTVEIYDVVSESRRKWDIVVKDERLSFRVRVE